MAWAQIALLIYLAVTSLALLMGVVVHESDSQDGAGCMVLFVWAILIVLIVLAGGFSHFSIN